MKKLMLIFSLCLVFVMTACYDDYKSDFDNNAVYFAYQYPVRSMIVNPATDEMKFEVGAAYAGKYSYGDVNKTVNFEIVDSLVTKNQDCIDKGIKLMPSSWFTLSDDSKMVIENDNAGSVWVNLVKDSLLAHNDAANITYAIPFKITSTTADSILEGKDFTIVVVKFKNEYDGRYYVKGSDIRFDAVGNPTDTTNYFVEHKDALVLNKYVYLNTISPDEVSISRIGQYEDGSKYTMIMKIEPVEGKADISADASSAIKPIIGKSKFDFNTSKFASEYTFTDEQGFTHTAVDTLIYSNTEMKVEEWK